MKVTIVLLTALAGLGLASPVLDAESGAKLEKRVAALNCCCVNYPVLAPGCPSCDVLSNPAVCRNAPPACGACAPPNDPGNPACRAAAAACVWNDLIDYGMDASVVVWSSPQEFKLGRPLAGKVGKNRTKKIPATACQLRIAHLSYLSHQYMA
ncbi:hypothetical protein HRG_012392 [Hirsutella rhossiliensis]